MKHLFSIISIILLFSSVSLFSQSRVYAPSLYFPEDAEMGISPEVSLDWNAVTGEELEILYEVQLATNMDFTDAITFEKTEVTALMVEDLGFGQLYFWKVRAYDGSDISDWSEIWSFTVTNSVIMVEPSDASMVYSTVNITWEELTGLNNYQIQIDTSYVWNSIALETTEDIFGSFILSETNQWLVGDNGLLLHLEDGNWSSIDAGISSSLNDIFFIDENNGYIVGDDGIFLMFDGSTWNTIDVGVTDNLSGVAFIDATNGYLVGDDGLILKYTDGTITTEVAKNEADEDITDDLYDVAAVSADNYWACGKGKTIVNYDGTSWSGGDVGGKDHYDLWFINASDGWVASKDGRLQHYDGNEWTEVETEADDLFGISFDGSTGYAAGKNGEMVVYDGSNWNKITSGSSETLNTLYLKDGFGISGGDEGTLLNKAGEGFNSPYAKIYTINPDSTNYDVNNLPFGTSFYYRMRGYHSQDTSDWSGAKSMTSYPYPDLVSPSEGHTGEPLEIVFEWTEYIGVTRYYIEVSKNEDFTNSLNYISDSNSILLKGFEFGEDYFWRVKAEHSEDISPWSYTWDYTTVNSIDLLTPEDNATEVNVCPRYTWEEVIGASAYQIYIDADDNFSNPIDKIAEDAFYQCEGAMESGTYFWKVRGIAGLDTSDWSPVWSFQTEGPEAIEDIFTRKSLNIFPNPSQGEFTVDINSVDAAVYSVSVTDINGKTIYQTEYQTQQGSNQIKINLTNELNKGVYMVNVALDNISVTKQLFIK